MRNSEREEMYQQVVMLLTQQTHAYMNVVMMWSYKVCCRWACMQQLMSHLQALQEPELTRGNGLAAGGSVQGWGRIQRSQKTSAVQPENDASVQVHIGGESTLHDTLHVDILSFWSHCGSTGTQLSRVKSEFQALLFHASPTHPLPKACRHLAFRMCRKADAPQRSDLVSWRERKHSKLCLVCGVPIILLLDISETSSILLFWWKEEQPTHTI